jgi:DNA-binding IclR family transcriptional regulator
VSIIINEVGLPARTSNTITDPDELLAELETIREEGIAFNDCERVLNVRALAVLILHGKRSVGSISVAGPKNRLTDDFF